KSRPRNQKSHRRQQKRWNLLHSHPDRVIRRPPNKINNPKRQQRLPPRLMCRGIHSNSPTTTTTPLATRQAAPPVLLKPLLLVYLFCSTEISPSGSIPVSPGDSPQLTGS